MEKSRQYRTLGIIAACICFFTGLAFNPISYEIYLDPDWRLENFGGFFAILCLEFLLLFAGFRLLSQSREENYTEKGLRFFQLFCSICGAVLFLLLSAETFVRIRYPAHSWYQFSFEEFDSVLGWKTQANDTITIPVKGKRARIPLNSYGFRGKLNDKSFRPFVVMGDELVFGWPVSRRTLFTEILNREKKRSGDVFYNFGVPGYSTLQELLLLRKWNDSLPADTVFLVFNLQNDFEDIKPESFYFFFNRPEALVSQRQLKIKDPIWELKEKTRKYLIEKSPEFHLLNQLKGEKRIYEPGKDYLKGEDFFQSILPNGDSSLLISNEVILREINKEIKKNDRVLAILIVPSPAQSRRKEARQDVDLVANWMARIAEKYQFYFLDASPDFSRGSPEGKPAFDPNDGSLTPEGQEIMAAGILKLRNKLKEPLPPGLWKRPWNLNGEANISEESSDFEAEIPMPEPEELSEPSDS